MIKEVRLSPLLRVTSSNRSALLTGNVRGALAHPPTGQQPVHNGVIST
jgi:hypothetical protein